MGETCRRWWYTLTPEQARGIALPAAGIVGPLTTEGTVCPWPWDPEQRGPSGLGMYHCPYCGEMVVAGLPHVDYREDPGDVVETP